MALNIELPPARNSGMLSFGMLNRILLPLFLTLLIALPGRADELDLKGWGNLPFKTTTASNLWTALPRKA
ncbi:MAG: hypothetical protein HC904_17845 [Blastochloris sp.]|nr:hypothetical protein [Blastochloris sp.]